MDEFATRKTTHARMKSSGARAGGSVLAGAFVVLALSACSGESPPPLEYEQYQASEFPAGNSWEPIVSVSDDGAVLKVERIESPYCASIPTTVSRDAADALLIEFDHEAVDAGQSCPDVGAWMVSEIRLEAPITEDQVTVQLITPYGHNDGTFTVEV